MSRPGLQTQDWKDVNQRILDREWIKINSPDQKECWTRRWTVMQLEQYPHHLEEFELLIDPAVRQPRQDIVSWRPGSPHYGLSRFMTGHLRGTVEATKYRLQLEGNEGWVDLDFLMSDFIPPRDHPPTFKLIGEVIKYSEKGRFDAKVVKNDGITRVMIRANQGHFEGSGVDLSKTCERLTLENCPKHCLHATRFRNYRSIISKDRRTNGLWPGGLPGFDRGRNPRSEVHAATVPPGVGGTTISHLKEYDVLIDIDIYQFIKDGGEAYRSKNGVILFPNRVDVKYIREVFDRSRDKCLFRATRTNEQRLDTLAQSAREDQALYRCRKCRSTDVDQDQSPWSWPGATECSQCISEALSNQQRHSSLNLERVRGMEATEASLRLAAENTETAREQNAESVYDERNASKRSRDLHEVNMRPIIEETTKLQKRLEQDREALARDANEEIASRIRIIGDSAYAEEIARIHTERSAEIQRLNKEAADHVDAILASREDQRQHGVDYQGEDEEQNENDLYDDVLLNEHAQRLLRENASAQRAQQLERRTQFFLQQEQKYQEIRNDPTRDQVAGNADSTLINRFLSRAERDPDRLQANNHREAVQRRSFDSLITAYPCCSHCDTKLTVDL
ncbi:MAG: hypothetical protein CMC97_01695, partial [Flavobacteriales bacterium]|nr:hypothetical protein [Flavobacteriales bacterium]